MRPHEELAAEAASVPPGCGGVRFLPYLVGERSPNWPKASGALTGLRPGSLSTPGVGRCKSGPIRSPIRSGAHRMTEFTGFSGLIRRMLSLWCRPTPGTPWYPVVFAVGPALAVCLQALKPKHDKPLSNFAIKCGLRPSTPVLYRAAVVGRCRLTPG